MTVEWCSIVQKYELIFFFSNLYFLTSFSWWLTFRYYRFNIKTIIFITILLHNTTKIVQSYLVRKVFATNNNILFCHKNLHPRHPAYQKLQFYSNRHYLYHRRVPWFEIVVKVWICNVCTYIVGDVDKWYIWICNAFISTVKCSNSHKLHFTHPLTKHFAQRLISSYMSLFKQCSLNSINSVNSVSSV